MAEIKEVEGTQLIEMNIEEYEQLRNLADKALNVKQKVEIEVDYYVELLQIKKDTERLIDLIINNTELSFDKHIKSKDNNVLLDRLIELYPTIEQLIKEKGEQLIKERERN